MKKERRLSDKIWICLGLVAALAIVCRAQAQGRGPKYMVDPSWPKPLPEKWVNGQVSGVCVDTQDNIFIVNRNDMTDKEGGNCAAGATVHRIRSRQQYSE
jgi:hypothetical protein